MRNRHDRHQERNERNSMSSGRDGMNRSRAMADSGREWGDTDSYGSYRTGGRPEERGRAQDYGYEDSTRYNSQSDWRPQDQDYGYGSTESSRNLRNQREDRYEGAMDFGSHAFRPQNSSYGNSADYNAGRFSSQNYAPSAGRFAGKGPKGYKRSDERIKEEISELIMHHPEVDGSDIEVEVASADVTLTGSVPERKMKHAVEDLIERTLGVGEIHNQLKVKKSDSAESGDGSSERTTGKSAAGKKSSSAENPRH
jgi:osmotically-inducible protein OsmY